MRVWRIAFGQCVKEFYTDYHAEQFARALRMNGTEFSMAVTDTAIQGAQA